MANMLTTSNLVRTECVCRYCHAGRAVHDKYNTVDWAKRQARRKEDRLWKRDQSVNAA